MTCDPATLMQDATCYRCIPPRIQNSIQTYQLAAIAGETPDPNSLMRLATEFFSRIPAGLQEAVQIKLLCDILDQLD